MGLEQTDKSAKMFDLDQNSQNSLYKNVKLFESKLIVKKVLKKFLVEFTKTISAAYSHGKREIALV